MILKLHLATSNVTTCPEPSAPPSINVARSDSRHAWGPRCRSVGNKEPPGFAKPFSASPQSRILMQVQVSRVLSCSSLWAGFSNLGCMGQPLREASMSRMEKLGFFHPKITFCV